MSAASDALILFANEAFYAAFASGDPVAMNDVWARKATLACLHPGADPLFDRDDIMESWGQILTGSPPPVTCRQPRIVSRAGVALVVCYEAIGEGGLVATNGFVLEEGRWRMVLHQGGPCETVPAADAQSEISARPN